MSKEYSCNVDIVLLISPHKIGQQKNESRVQNKNISLCEGCYQKGGLCNYNELFVAPQIATDHSCTPKYLYIEDYVFVWHKSIICVYVLMLKDLKVRSIQGWPSRIFFSFCCMVKDFILSYICKQLFYMKLTLCPIIFFECIPSIVAS